MPRFLVVDDDPPTVHAMTQLLAGDGHEVTPCTAGAEAVDALARSPFDVVMTDLEMPRVDGHAVIRATREQQPGACLVVTTSRGVEREHELAHAGACMVADKPIDYDAATGAVLACRAGGGRAGHGACPLRAKRPK
jgi:CheY-like chemotaxis protein